MVTVTLSTLILSRHSFVTQEPCRSHHTKKGNPLRVHVKIWRLWKKVPALRDNYSMEVDLLKYSHTSHERASIVNLFQWHDGQNCCETDKEGIFTCEWSYCLLHVSWESFDIFIESGLFRLGGAQISGGKNHEAQTLPLQSLYGETPGWTLWKKQEMSLCSVACTCISMENSNGGVRPSRSFPGLHRQHCLPILHANICIHVVLLQV